ncbi:TerC family protein [Fructilactobacillus cliffordii]|uniref:TerC family protein n=1 Tax=Fructilactobacillus cliffordii TaxID=2940299 RepID=UPI00209303CB|nr:TerC family protein [Fructilactobacillus cliffordii]USS87217.1 TerC family protein [Fructilactobacillus cliffordii]
MALLEKLYGPFFDLHNWETVLTSGNDWLIIFSLVVLECVMSVDNAIVLATQTQVLPTKKLQEESLFYGLWGAYIFRFLVIGAGVYLIHFWEIKVVGAIYLIYLSVKYFFPRRSKSGKKRTVRVLGDPHSRKFFWWVVIQIEFMDILFSIDSVLASLAVSNNPVVVLIGGMVGILAMRGIAEFIMKIMKRIPELKTMAYVLVFMIGVKLFLSIPAIDIEIPATWFGIFVIAAIVVTLIIHFIRQRRNSNGNGAQSS